MRRTVGDLVKKSFISEKKPQKWDFFEQNLPLCEKKLKKSEKLRRTVGDFGKKSFIFEKKLKNETFFTKISHCAKKNCFKNAFLKKKNFWHPFNHCA